MNHLQAERASVKIDGQRRKYPDDAKRRYYAEQRSKRYSRFIASLATR